jgi:enoyl-[acyl-carrier protein] reductase II
MGTRMVSALESPIHEGWKRAIVAAPETGTVMIKPPGRPALRALRTERTERLERDPSNAMEEMGAGVRAVYFGGDVNAGVALSGQVAGRIESVRPVADILRDTVNDFRATLESLGKRYLRT